MLSRETLDDFLATNLACPLCRTGLARNADGWHCPSCATVFRRHDSYVDFLCESDPLSTKVQTDFSDHYQVPRTLHWEAFGKSVERYWLSLASTFSRYLGHPARCLDIGRWLVWDGSSRPPRAYDDALSVLCMLDPDEHQLQRADELVFLARGIGERLPFRDQAFDLLVVHATLDHCVDYQRTLDESLRVLAPGGLISILLNNDGSWAKRLFRGEAQRRRQSAGQHHNVFLKPSMVTRELGRRGFEVLRLRGIRYLMLPEFMLEAVCRMFGRRASTLF